MQVDTEARRAWHSDEAGSFTVFGDGDAGYLDDTPGAMLGAAADTAYATSHASLAPGARLLFYTDGLIEDRRRDITEGFTALARAMRRSAPTTSASSPSAAKTSQHRDPDVDRRTPALAGATPPPAGQPLCPFGGLSAATAVAAGVSAPTG